MQNSLALFCNVVFLPAAGRLVGDGHCKPASFEQGLDLLISELCSARPASKPHQITNAYFLQAVMQYFHLVPTWSRLGPDLVPCGQADQTPAH